MLQMKNSVILKRTIIISFIIILIDQISKILAISICENGSIEIINNVFSLNLTKNIGVAFSLNKDNIKNIIISFFIIVFILRYLFTNQKFINKITLTSLDLVLAGGISNLVDRIFRGGVIDFIQISSFPIFNFADCMIVIGWMLFAIYIIKVEVRKK